MIYSLCTSGASITPGCIAPIAGPKALHYNHFNPQLGNTSHLTKGSIVCQWRAVREARETEGLGSRNGNSWEGCTSTSPIGMELLYLQNRLGEVFGQGREVSHSQPGAHRSVFLCPGIYTLSINLFATGSISY